MADPVVAVDRVAVTWHQATGACPSCGIEAAMTSASPLPVTPTWDCPKCQWKGAWTPAERRSIEQPHAL